MRPNQKIFSEIEARSNRRFRVKVNPRKIRSSVISVNQSIIELDKIFKFFEIF